MRHTALPLAVAMLAPLGASAQDLLTVAPELAKVEYEDARVRVVRLHIPERGSIATHDRPRRVVVSLSPNHVRLTGPGGTSRETRTAAGSVAWSEPAVRSVTNLGGPVDNVVVELPQAAEPATPVAGEPDPGGRTLDEPRHRWVFENQYVRVYDVRIPPGETTAFHRHAYDQVAVFVSGGVVSAQSEGRPWGPPATIEPHRVRFDAHASQPLAHRVRNDGAREYHTILVQFLR